MLGTIAGIAAGGATGSVLRHGVNMLAHKALGDAFPWGTLGVNIAGSFLIGFLGAYFTHVWQPPQEVRMLLITGFLGGFTTFSAFSLDAVMLWQRGSMFVAALYVAASVILSIGALLCAMYLVRSMAV